MGSVDKLCEADTPLCSPVLDADGQLFVCSNLQGKVHHVAEGDGASQLAVSGLSGGGCREACGAIRSAVFTGSHGG